MKKDLPSAMSENSEMRHDKDNDNVPSIGSWGIYEPGDQKGKLS
jgi:hypothetical protein